MLTYYCQVHCLGVYGGNNGEPQLRLKPFEKNVLKIWRLVNNKNVCEIYIQWISLSIHGYDLKINVYVINLLKEF